MRFFKKGNGEMIGFAVVGVFLCVLFLFFVSFMQLTYAMNSVNSSLSVLSRSAAICGSMKDAKKQVKGIKDHAVASQYIKPGSVKVSIDYAEKGKNKDKWYNGNYIKVTVKAKIKTLEPFFTSRKYKKSFIVAIEGASSSEGEAVEVMRNIIYAVESGGQTYGGRDYANWEPPGANTSSEHYITIGAGCWYGIEAKQILEYIYSKHGNSLGNLSGIIAAWESVKYGAYKDEIIKIMDTPEGHQRQDEFMAMQITEYFKKAEQQGVTDIGGKMEYMNIIHQGGQGAVNRLLQKAEKPVTATSFYNAMKGDSGNQVGAYKTRQNLVYNWIRTKVGVD